MKVNIASGYGLVPSYTVDLDLCQHLPSLGHNESEKSNTDINPWVYHSAEQGYLRWFSWAGAAWSGHDWICGVLRLHVPHVCTSKLMLDMQWIEVLVLFFQLLSLLEWGFGCKPHKIYEIWLWILKCDTRFLQWNFKCPHAAMEMADSFRISKNIFLNTNFASSHLSHGALKDIWHHDREHSDLLEM